MSDLYENYGLEMESEAYGAEPNPNPNQKPKVIVKKKSGLLGKVVCLLLGFVLGAGGVVGGVALVVNNIANTPLESTFNVLSDLGIKIDYTKYIREEYAKKVVKELVGDVADVVGKFSDKTATLNDLDAISPMIGTGVDGLLEQVESFGLMLDKTTLMSTTVGELPDYLMDSIQSLELASFLKIDITDEEADPLLHALAFGYEGEHFEIEEGVVTWYIDPETNEQYGPKTIADLTNMTETLNEIRIATALSVTHESAPFMIALAYGSEGIGYKFETDEEGNKIGITPLEDPNTLADLTASGDDNLLNTLKLKDFLGSDSFAEDDILLKHLAEETIVTLPNAVKNLTFKKVYPRQIYYTEYAVHDENGTHTSLYLNEKNQKYYYESDYKTLYEGDESLIDLEYKYINFELAQTDENGQPLLDEDGNQVYKPVADPFNGKGYIAEGLLEYNDKTHYYHYYARDPEGNVTADYKVHLELISQWEYLLTEKDHEAHDYALTDFGNLVQNMMYNMQTTTLGKLSTDGLLSNEQLSTSTLETEVITSIFTDEQLEDMHITRPAEGEKLYLRDLTITQMFNYSAALISIVTPSN